jgi:serine/threonine-protein kinase
MRCPRDGWALVEPADLADADGDPFLGATVAGRFVVLGRLGAGSMGTVYRARQEAMGRSVAIKILRSDRAYDAQAKARFTREAKAMSLLTSPYTVTVFDFGEIPEPVPPEHLSPSSGSLYLAMEMLEGQSLGARLKHVGRLPLAEALRIARHALLSLAEAHEKGIIHRDLKPDNLFLVPPVGDGEPRCKVLDFGIAKVVSDIGVDVLETQAGTVFGTPRYMSPEQAQGKPLDARSDLYSLGVLLYQMLVGRAPFVDDDAVVVMARHIKTVPKSPILAAPDAGIPAAVSDLVMRALAKEPQDRPQTARDFIAAIDRVEVSAPAPTVLGSGELAAVVHADDLDAGPAARRSKRSRALPLAATILAIAGAGLAAAAVVRSGPVPLVEARAGVARSFVDRSARARVAAVAPPPAAPTEAAVARPAETAIPASVPTVAPRRPFAPKKYTRFE